MLLAALVIPAWPHLQFSITTSALTWVRGGEAIIRIDTLSAILLLITFLVNWALTWIQQRARP